MTDKRATMKGGARKGAGRKPRPDDRMIRVSLSLTPEQYDWLKDRPEGMAVTVRYFILQAMSRERIDRKPHMLDELMIISTESASS